jgi:MoxR-like ATPase
LLKLSRARAAMEGREFVIPDDVKFIVKEALVHRLLIKPDIWTVGISAADVVERILKSVPVPKLE